MLQLRALSLLICIDLMDVLSNYSSGRTVWMSPPPPTTNLLVSATHSSQVPTYSQACHESELVLLMVACKMLHLFLTVEREQNTSSYIRQTLSLPVSLPVSIWWLLLLTLHNGTHLHSPVIKVS